MTKKPEDQKYEENKSTKNEFVLKIKLNNSCISKIPKKYSKIQMHVESINHDKDNNFSKR